MGFKVGDEVRVREDLKFGSSYENIFVTAGMYENRGLVSEVSDISLGHYELKDDSTNYIWSESMLEPVEEEMKMETKKYVKFDIPEWVNWLARDEDGSLYGYTNKPIKCSRSWGIGTLLKDEKSLVFITEDPDHYPQVKWSDEEPKQYKDGITINPHGALAAIQNYGRFVDPGSADGIYRTPEDAPTVEVGVDMIQNQAPDMVNTPPHYKQYSFEPIDIITEVVKEYPPEIGFHVGTVLKYLFRSPFKGKQLQDLEKAEYYLQRAIKELEETK